MIIRAILVHGWDGNPENAWFPWMRERLEMKKFVVIAPAMPDPAVPKIEPWIDCLGKSIVRLKKDDMLIGHSIGCQAILRYLQGEKAKAMGAVLVAPWLHLDEKTIAEEGDDAQKIAKPWIETPIDWKSARAACSEFVCIFSDNDPYVPLSDAEIFRKKLSSKIIIEKKMGHFDDSAGIRELPCALKAVFDLAGIS